MELVGRIGDDAAGNALLIALARSSVGHAAVLRDPVRPTRRSQLPAEPDDEDPFADPASTAPSSAAGEGPLLEPADVALGLSYLTAFDVLVVTDEVPVDVIPATVDAAAFAGASLVVVLAHGAHQPSVPASALVLGSPGDDDGAFGALVGVIAAGLDRGLAPEDALRAATGAAGWEPVAGDG